MHQWLDLQRNLKARVLKLLTLYSGTRAHCTHCLFKDIKNCAFICFLFCNVSLGRQKERNCFYLYRSKQQTIILQKFIYIISFSVYILSHCILSLYTISLYIFIFSIYIILFLEQNYASKNHQILKTQGQLRYPNNAIKRDTR